MIFESFSKLLRHLIPHTFYFSTLKTLNWAPAVPVFNILRERLIPVKIACICNWLSTHLSSLPSCNINKSSFDKSVHLLLRNQFIIQTLLTQEFLKGRITGDTVVFLQWPHMKPSALPQTGSCFLLHVNAAGC